MGFRLEIELQEANMAPTCERLGEEIHARIVEANASIGRNLLPVQCKARARAPGHFARLDEDWMIEAFLRATWKQHYALALCKTLVGDTATQLATLADRVHLIYHCSTRQFSQSLNYAKRI